MKLALYVRGLTQGGCLAVWFWLWAIGFKYCDVCEHKTVSKNRVKHHVLSRVKRTVMKLWVELKRTNGMTKQLEFVMEGLPRVWGKVTSWNVCQAKTVKTDAWRLERWLRWADGLGNGGEL